MTKRSQFILLIALVAGCQTAPTPTSSKCRSNADCSTGYVCNAAQVCIATSDPQNTGGTTPGTCDDGARNQDEADIDCGGNCSQKCGLQAACRSDGDCQSQHCVNNHCRALLCSNGIKDDNETAVDCGGDCATQESKRCALNADCLLDADCQSNRCQNKKCAAPVTTCQNGKKDNDETAVDCGGSCPRCSDGQACLLASDCLNQFCNRNKQCTQPTCADGELNQNESDVDCGGTCAGNEGKKCALQSACTQTNDCNSSKCYVASGQSRGTCVQCILTADCQANGKINAVCVGNVCSCEPESTTSCACGTKANDGCGQVLNCTGQSKPTGNYLCENNVWVCKDVSTCTGGTTGSACGTVKTGCAMAVNCACAGNNACNTMTHLCECKAISCEPDSCLPRCNTCHPNDTCTGCVCN